MTPAVDREGLVVTGVSRSFGKVHAVQHATLRAYPGEVTALIGPNGSGKTTLMLMLASLLQPDAGSILVAGHDPVRDPAGVRAAMGWMPDLLGSWATLTVRATLEITGRLYGMDRPRAGKRASELVSLVRLEGLENQPTRVLSRGQKQRLSLARSLVHNPSVLLLDEPASGLDPAARIALRQLVRSLAAEGRTLLISSHVLAELDEMADRAVYLAAGVDSVRGARPAQQVDRSRLAHQVIRHAVVENHARGYRPRRGGRSIAQNCSYRWRERRTRPECSGCWSPAACPSAPSRRRRASSSTPSWN